MDDLFISHLALGPPFSTSLPLLKLSREIRWRHKWENFANDGTRMNANDDSTRTTRSSFSPPSSILLLRIPRQPKPQQPNYRQQR